MIVEKRTKVEEIFISDDGKEFTSEESCLYWEKVSKLQKVYIVIDRGSRTTSVFSNKERATSFARSKCRDFYISEEYIDLYAGEE